MTKRIIFAAFFLAPMAVSAGPALEQLRSAASGPPAGSLECQARDSGASFHGGQASARPSLRDSSPAQSLSPVAKPAVKEAAAPPVRDGKAPPPLTKKEERDLKRVRAAGFVAAAAGAGLMAYAVIAATAGPVGWAAALLFAGGMAAYLAQRRLNGKSALG